MFGRQTAGAHSFGAVAAAVVAASMTVHTLALGQEVATSLVRDGSIGPDAHVQPTAIPIGGAEAQGLLAGIPGSPPADTDGGLLVIDEALGMRSTDGSTLFHSFARFDVGAPDTVLFTANPDFGSTVGIQNVITRVTGGDPSRIYGQLSSSVKAEFYFLNPSGVLFGPGARLATTFTFIASTADQLAFADGNVFEATRGGSIPLLMVPDVTEFRFRESTGSITVDGGSLDLQSGTLGLVTGGPGTAIGIVAPSLPPLILGDSVRAFMPRMITELKLVSRSSGASNGTGSLILRDARVAFGTNRGATASFGGRNDRALLAADSIDALRSRIATDGEGLLQLLSGGPIRITETSLDIGFQLGTPDPLGRSTSRAALTISSDLLQIDRSFLAANNQIEFHSKGSTRIVDSTVLSRAGSTMLTSDLSLAIENSMVLSPKFSLSTQSPIGIGVEVPPGTPLPTTAGIDGRIDLAAPLIEINGSRISASAPNRAIGGFSVGDSITVSGDRVRISSSELSTQALLTQDLFIPSAGMRVGGDSPKAGSISILAGEIEILDGSTLSSSAILDTFSETDDTVPLLIDAGLLVRLDSVTGSAGQIQLQATGTVRIGDSRLSTTVDATKSDQLGSILVEGGRVEIDGSSLSSEARGVAAGSVTIRTPGEVTLRNSSLTSSATGSGRAGSVLVDAASLRLSTGSEIATRAERGPAAGQPADGNIDILLTDRLLLEGASTISASVMDGQGGDVRIASPKTTVLRDGSLVLAQTALGNGGRIDITTDVFLADSSSRVSADANMGTNGSVEIRSPDVDLQGSIEALSSEFVNTSALLRPSCDVRAAAGNTGSFYVAGQPGLPASPEEFLLAFDAPGVAPSVDASISSPSPRALLALAQGQQADGSYAESLATLRDALSKARREEDATDLAALLGASGNAQQALGQSGPAEELLTRGSSLARSEGDGALASRLENDLGNHYAASGASERARASYAEAVTLAENSGDALAAARALANAARAALEARDDSAAAALLARADERVEAIAASRAKAALLIHLGYSHARRKGAASLLRAHALLQSAADLARTLGDARLRSYALGNLGALYQSEGRFDEALVLTREALRSAERAQAPDVTYRWNYQEGQLLWAQGKAESAVQSYRRAVQILEETRQESRARYGSQATSFRRSLAPVYLDLADALLRGADLLEAGSASEGLLLEARATVEKLKAAELRNYLRDDCSAYLEARTASLDSLAAGAAVVYPIALRDRLELLVRLPKGLERFTVPIGAAQIEAEARQFRRQVLDRTSSGYRASARRLYDWLVRPYADKLASQGAQTLVFVPDGALRTLPMAALHDGERFLAERFALAIAPGLSLVDPRPLDLARVKPLLGGVSQPVEGFGALGNVPRELAAIRELFGGEVLLDSSFEAERIEGAIAESRPTLVHLASHAVFTGDPATSFLLTHDGRMTMDELANVLGRTRYRADPIELLVLSACDTALGDDRAALGLAGVAVRSGARSALGSLWAIADDATYPLIADFYARLHEPGVSRAEALRHAQRTLLANETFAHPYYWSAFVLVSNWL